MNDNMNNISTPVNGGQEYNGNYGNGWTPSQNLNFKAVASAPKNNVGRSDPMSARLAPELVNQQINTGAYNVSHGQISSNLVMSCIASPLDTFSGLSTPTTLSEDMVRAASHLSVNPTENDGTQYLQSLLFKLSHSQNGTNGLDIDRNAISNGISAILENLNSPNLVQVTKAAFMMNSLLKNEMIRNIILEDTDISKLLVRCALDNIKNGSILRSCIASLYCVSLKQRYAHVLYASNVLMLFFIVSDFGSDAILFYMISIIHKLVLDVQEARQFLSTVEHLDVFLKLFACQNEKFLAIVMDIFRLCAKFINIDFLVKHDEFLTNIITTLENKKYEKLIIKACLLVKELSASPSLKTSMIRHGGVHVLTKHLLHVSRKVAVVALLTIRSLSDAICSNQRHDDLIDILIRFVSNQLNDINKRDPSSQFEEQLVVSSLSILANVTCNNPENKETLVNRGFLPQLVELCQSSTSKSILESSFCTLRHITCRHDQSSAACQEFVRLNGLALATNILHNHASSSFLFSVHLKKAIFGLLANLANHKVYLSAMSELKITHLAAHTLASVMEEVKKNGLISSTPPDIKPSDWISHVHSCKKLLEVCVVLLNMLLMDDLSLQLMINSPILASIFCSLLITVDGSILFYVINYLCEISTHQDGLIIVANAFKSLENGDKSNTNILTSNICICRLREIYTHSKTSSTVRTTISNLISRLSQTEVIKGLGTFFDGVGNVEMDEDNKWQNFIESQYQKGVDSPMTISPSHSGIYNRT